MLRISVIARGPMVAVILPLCLCLLVACGGSEDSAPAQQMDTAEVAQDIDPSIPPPELLQTNYEIASHVAVVDVQKIEIADRIYADDGTLGYVVEHATGDLIKSYKGDFGSSREIEYFNFLEYPTAPESDRLDTLLVFLSEDADSSRLMAIEVGQFRYSDSLGRIVAALLRSH